MVIKNGQLQNRQPTTISLQLCILNVSDSHDITIRVISTSQTYGQIISESAHMSGINLKKSFTATALRHQMCFVRVIVNQNYFCVCKAYEL